MTDVLNASVSELNIKSVVEKLGDVMYKYPFSLPPYYIAIIRCLGVLEGVALQVDNDVAILKDAYPYIASRLLTDDSPRLQAALVALVVRGGKLRWQYLEALLDNAADTSEYDIVASIERLADYLLSPAGAPVLVTLTDQLVEELDELGAESAGYVYTLLSSLVAPLLATATAAASGDGTSPRREGGPDVGTGAGTADGVGDSGSIGVEVGSGSTAANVFAGPLALLAEQLNKVPLPPPSPRLARALRIAELLQRSARSRDVDLSRVGTLAATLLSQEAVQRQLADFTLRLVERTVYRGIRSLFSLQDADGGEVPKARSSRPTSSDKHEGRSSSADAGGRRSADTERSSSSSSGERSTRNLANGEKEV